MSALVQPTTDEQHRVARAALAHYNAQLVLATEHDGRHRVPLVGQRQVADVMPKLVDCIARNSLVDVRDALDYAVFGDGTPTGPPVRITGKGEVVAGWLHNHMSDKPTYDLLDGDELLLDAKMRSEGRLPTYDEVPAFRVLLG